MLVAPAEPRPFLELSDDNEYSPTPESYGADFLWVSNGNVCGAQRKTCADLIASIRDDRIAREMCQLKELHRAILVVEGSWRWGHDGKANLKGYDHQFLRSQYDGIVMSMQANNIWVLTTDNIPGTIGLLRQLEGFTSRESHTSLFVRPKTRGLWGTYNDRDWSLGILGWVPGWSIGTAGAFYDQLGLPLQLTCTEDEVKAVPSVGPKRARALMNAFHNG